MELRPVSDLDFGFNDAENYKRRENKKLLNDLFIRSSALDKLCENQTFFLIGEKGTGKTAYSVYLSNNEYRNSQAQLNYIRETDYQSFIALKREKHLLLSDYTAIWRVILLVLLAKSLDESEIETSLMPRFLKLRALRNALDEYANSAFSPEIITAFNFAKESLLLRVWYPSMSSSILAKKIMLPLRRVDFRQISNT